MTEEGATVGPSEPDQAPPWLQALLDHQNQSLKVMLAPVLTHITRGNSAAQHALPPLAVSNGDVGEILQQASQDAASLASWEDWYLPRLRLPVTTPNPWSEDLDT